MPPSTLVIGAAGAVGKRLCAALASRGTRVIASDRMPLIPGTLRRVLEPSPSSVAIGGVDVRDPNSLQKLFQEHAEPDTIVWNLAAPLSVETALDPAVAEEVTIGGMQVAPALTRAIDSDLRSGCRQRPSAPSATPACRARAPARRTCSRR